MSLDQKVHLPFAQQFFAALQDVRFVAIHVDFNESAAFLLQVQGIQRRVFAGVRRTDELLRDGDDRVFLFAVQRKVRL